MRHIACDTDGCLNQGAPYFDFEPEQTIVLCPHCAKAMVLTTIPAPDVPTTVEAE